MTVLSPTATWDTIQNVFYRKEEVYQMSWRIPDLSDYLVAAAKNGGPIGACLPGFTPRRLEVVQRFSSLLAALIRDERKVMLLGKHSTGKPKIHVHTSSGLPITSFTVSSICYNAPPSQ